MKEDKNKAISFFKQKGIDARPISKKIAGKTPDLELYINDFLYGFCEIKTIVNYDFIGERPDPTPNKIQKKIHKSAQQFKDYNQNHKAPNILLFINHQQKILFDDLWEVLTGEPTGPFGSSEPINTRYAKRLAGKNDLEYIDFFVWIDPMKDCVRYTLNGNSKFRDSLKENVSSVAFEKFNDSKQMKDSL